MKKGIHPQLYTDAQIVCACGNSFTTMSTRKVINVEICSACHPFFTGQQKFVDTEGRIEKFAKKLKTSADKKADAELRKSPKTKKVSTQTDDLKVSLRDLLKQAKEITDKSE